MNDAQREIAEQVRAMIPRLVDKRISTIRENLIAEVLRRIDFESLSDDVLEVTSKRISVFGGSSLIPRINADTVDFLAPNAGNTVQNLAGSAGASIVGFLPSGTGATALNVQDYLRSLWATPQQFGGSLSASATVNDAAFAAALATGKAVWVSKGTWNVNQIKLPAGSVIVGESKVGTVIAYSGTQSKGIITDNQGGSTFYSENVLMNFTQDCNSLPNAATSFGIYFFKSWGNTIKDVRDATNASDGSTRLPANAFSCGSGTGFYTSVLDNCEFKAMSFTGAAGNDRVTTLTFDGVSTQYVVLNTVTAINFYGCTWQGSYAAKLDLTIANKVNIFGGDVEGSGFFLRFNGGNNTDVNYFNPDFTGFTGTLTTGTQTFTDDAYSNNWQYSPERGTAIVTMVPGTSGSITLTAANTISWSRRGDRLAFNGLLTVSSVSSPVGEVTIQGLPKTSKAGASGASSVSVTVDGLTAGATTSVMAYIQGGDTKIFVRLYTAGSLGALGALVQAGANFWIHGEYPL